MYRFAGFPPQRQITMLAIEKNTILSSAASQSVNPQWLRPAPAAVYSGMSRGKVYQELASGKLKSHLVGGCRLINRDELDRFIAGHPST